MTAPIQGARRLRTCEVCGEQYRPKMIEQRTCGRLCGHFLQHGRWPATHVDRRFHSCAVRADHPSRWIGDSCPVEYRECLWCDAPLGWQPATRGRFYCSDHCNIRMKQARRASRQSATPEAQTWTWGAFMRMAAKFGWCCAYCGTKPDRLDPDHVVPLARGGKNTLSNLLPTCLLCNSDKRDLSLTEWRIDRERRSLPLVVTTWKADDIRFTHLATHPGEVGLRAS